MAAITFPPNHLADENGLLALGGNLEAETLLIAYKQGIFPWPFDEAHLTWFSPPKRCIIYTNKIHFSKSLLKKTSAKALLFFKNKDFAAVVGHCATQGARGQVSGTWITQDIQQAYIELHQLGFCDSYECYQDNELVGGLYGVRIGSYFSGESMFHTKPNGSKLALWFLAQCLRKDKIEWIDCQVINPFLEKLGAVEIPREEYLGMLRKVIKY